MQVLDKCRLSFNVKPPKICYTRDLPYFHKQFLCLYFLSLKKKPLAKTLLTFTKSFDPSIFRLFKDQTKGVVIMS